VAVMAMFGLAQQALANLCDRGPTQPILLPNLDPLAFSPNLVGASLQSRVRDTIPPPWCPCATHPSFAFLSVSAPSSVHICFRSCLWGFCLLFPPPQRNMKTNEAAPSSTPFSSLVITPTCQVLVFSSVLCHCSFDIEYIPLRFHGHFFFWIY
jgi:hypothetical protein